MSSATSRHQIGEERPARTVGELMDALADMAGDDWNCPVLLPREDETLVVALVRDHGQVAFEIEPDSAETLLRRELHDCETRIENGEPDLDARREYLIGELRKERPEALTRADRARISDCLRACAKPLPYADTEKVALLDLAGRIEKGLV